MNRTSIKLVIPESSKQTNRVQVIKNIRALSGFGLYDAKMMADKGGVHVIDLVAGLTQETFDEASRILRDNNVEVCDPVSMILEDLRRLGSEALLQGEDELANEILQLVLSEKLRRNTLKY